MGRSEVIEYDDDDNVKTKTIKDGDKVIEVIDHNEDGVMISSKTYDKDGNYTYRKFFEGRTDAEISIQFNSHGRRHGKYLKFRLVNDIQDVILSVEYINGVIHSKDGNANWRQWDGNHLSISARIINGKLKSYTNHTECESLSFDDHGNIIEKRDYTLSIDEENMEIVVHRNTPGMSPVPSSPPVIGIVPTVIKSFHNNDNIHLEITVVNNVITSVDGKAAIKKYDEDGRLVTEKFLSDGKPMGGNLPCCIRYEYINENSG